MKLPREFYIRTDVVKISKELLGKTLVTNFNGIRTSGMITETEAYKAPEDKASHAYNNKRTPRTETFYTQGGTAYVYLCYGVHHLFNIVTNKVDVPHAILIRAVQPLEGIEEMLLRRNKKKLDRTLTSGPGTLSQALGISTKHNGLDLVENHIWIEEGIKVNPRDIASGPRIGIDYAKEYVSKPWRFWIKNNEWVSKSK